VASDFNGVELQNLGSAMRVGLSTAYGWTENEDKNMEDTKNARHEMHDRTMQDIKLQDMKIQILYSPHK